MSRAKVLLVDDDPAFVEAMHASLAFAGYEVHEALDGSEALDRAEWADPDVILLDIRMPGINGYEVCQVLKKHPTTKRIPVVFLTAVDDTAMHRLACEAGGSGCLIKPFPIERLTAVIQAVVASA